MEISKTSYGSIKISHVLNESLIERHYYKESKENALKRFKIEIEKIESESEVSKVKTVKKTLKNICSAFKIGKLYSFKVENYKIPGFLMVNFETNKGNYQYIFKN